MPAHTYHRRKRDAWNPWFRRGFIVCTSFAIFAGVSLTFLGNNVVEDDSKEQYAYETLGGLQSIRASLHTSESNMRVFLISADPSDRKGYEVAWNLTSKQCANIAPYLPNTRETASLFQDLRDWSKQSDSAVAAKASGKTVAMPEPLNGRIDRDVDGVLAAVQVTLDTAKGRRQQDFLLTEILFFCTMGLGALSIFLAVYGVGRDIVNSVTEEEAEQTIELDPITNLVTRGDFERILEEQMARAVKKRYPLTLLIIELDQLPTIREQRGDYAYEFVLRGTAAILRDVFRTTDTICRFSDTEFAVILPKADLENSQIPAERAREAVLATDWPNCYVTANFGVAQAEDDESTSSLIERALQVVEYARRTGRNRVSLKCAHGSLAA